MAECWKKPQQSRLQFYSNISFSNSKFLGWVFVLGFFPPTLNPALKSMLCPKYAHLGKAMVLLYLYVKGKTEVSAIVNLSHGELIKGQRPTCGLQPGEFPSMFCQGWDCLNDFSHKF